MRDFEVIENEKLKEQAKPKVLATNPIAKKFVKFHEDKKFSVKDLFNKNVWSEKSNLSWYDQDTEICSV